MSKALAAACAVWCLLVVALAAQGKTVWDGVYTEGQASRGQSDYTISCEGCHGEGLGGGPAYDTDAPALKRENFGVSRKDLGSLYSYVSMNMPRDNPGSLSESTYADIIAFLLQQNGMPAGQQELATNQDALATIRVVKKP